MTQQQILDLAKQGDIHAIEALINESLKPQGITAKVGLKDSCLYVALAAAKVPDRKALVKLICPIIRQWHIQYFNHAKIYAAEWGQNLPVWQQEIKLNRVRAERVKNPPAINATILSQDIKQSNFESSDKMPEKIAGNLAVGKFTIQLDSTSGSIVSRITQEYQEKYQIQLRDSNGIAARLPFLLPPRCTNLIGRLKEIKGAINALNSTEVSPESKQSIEFYGDSGFGKSALLRHFTHFIQTNRVFPDGTIFLNSHYQTASDLLQSLFDIFCESDINYKATDLEIGKALESKQVLLILDNRKLTSAEIKELQIALPNCRFALASPTKRLDENNFSIALAGLTTRDALTFFTQELERTINPDEFQSVEVLANLLGGNPWLLQLAATSINKEIYTLPELVLQLQASATSDVLIQGVLNAIPKSECTILAILAAINGIPLLTSQVEGLSGIAATPAILQNLIKWNLVENEQDRYYINDILITALQKEWDLSYWQELTLDYFTTWAERYSRLPSLLHSETDVLMETLIWAVKVERWEQVLRLVEAIETPLALDKQWGLWDIVLQSGLQASLVLNDKATEAWLLHQLGSRALCLEEMGKARNYLARAVKIRNSLGDENAVNISQQNFNLINTILSEAAKNEPELSINYTSTNTISTNPKIWIFGLIFLFCSGLAGFTAWFVLVRPKSLLVSQVNTTNLISKSDETITSAQVKLSSPKVIFGNQTINSTSKKQIVTVSNQSSTPVRVDDIENNGKQGDFEITSSCATTISPKQNCNISVVFAPIDTGKHITRLAVSDRNGKTLKTILIEGFAITSEASTDNLIPAPSKITSEPLALPKPKSISQPQLQKQPKPTIPTFPLESPPIPTSESPESITNDGSPEPTPTESTESPQPTPTESSEPTSSEEITVPTPSEKITVPAATETP
jgi:Abnormal spindle-like microcephaly-assoc'd, ASPM-SPD-2-Hydin